MRAPCTLLVPLAAGRYPFATVLLVDILIAVLFATSLHFIMGPGGMHSFGHAAYFGLGAYGAALMLKGLSMPMEAELMSVSPCQKLLPACQARSASRTSCSTRPSSCTK